MSRFEFTVYVELEADDADAAESIVFGEITRAISGCGAVTNVDVATDFQQVEA